MKTGTKINFGTWYSFIRVIVISILWLITTANLNARQLFYVLDGTSGPAYANMVKCFDLNGVFQYEVFSVDPAGSDAYSALATDGNILWLAGTGLGHIRSFAIRPGALGGITVPLQTTDSPTHGGCKGLALGNNSLWLSRALTWGTPTGRIEVYSTSGSYIQHIRTDVHGFYPSSLQMVGATVLIKDLQKDDKVYSIDTGSVWEPYGPLLLTGAPLSGRAICANGSRMWILGYSGGTWTAYAFDFSGNRQPASDAPFTRISQPADMYMAWGPDEGIIAVNPGNLDFGALVIGQTQNQSVVIKNVGNDTLVINAIELSDTTNYSLSPVSLPLSLGPGVSSTVSVTFDPQATGSFDAELLVRSADQYLPEVTVGLSGEGEPSLWYVDQEAPAGGDGQTWETAFQNIPEALAEPQVLDGAEIRVRGGYYHSGHIHVNKSVSLIGAFDSEGNRDLDDADWAFIDGQDASGCLKITADGVRIDGFSFENGRSMFAYPTNPGFGGAIYVEADNVTIANCWVGYSYASQGGGGIAVIGSDNTISNCMIEENETPQPGSGIFINGSNTTITQTEIVNNSSTQSSGGGIWAQGGPLTLADCTVHSNESRNTGAGISAVEISLTNCLITDNKVIGEWGQGAGVACRSLNALNCTIANNRLTGDYEYNSAGIHCQNPHVEDHCVITNCIIWGNTNDAGHLDRLQLYAYAPIATYSNIQDNNYGGPTGQGDANHNIRQEALFVNPNASNWWQKDYYLSANSPCVDSGTDAGAPAHDLESTARPWGPGYDMGAYEYVSEYPGPWRVDSSVSTSGDGASWAHAVQSVNEVLDRLRHIQEAEIWVRGGTYLNPSFDIGKPIRIYGGFNGTETQRDQRDYKNNVTVFDGNNEEGGPFIEADATLDGLTFTRCAEGRGGAVYTEGCNPTIANCTFTQNSAEEFGGAIFIDNSSPTISNCLFANNFANDVGGAIGMDESTPLIANCLFAGNTAINIAGAVSVFHSWAIIDNCTFVGNVLAQTDYSAAVDAYETDLVINNSIFRDNLTVQQPQQPDIAVDEADILVAYCNIEQDGFAGDNGNISVDPLFADFGYWDDNSTPAFPQDDFFVGGDYHLQSAAGRWDPASQSWTLDAQTSPSIDTGNPGMTPSDETAPDGNRINMGAYGGTDEASRTPAGWSLVADITNDGTADLNDLAIQLEAWMGQCDQCPGDLNRDGEVNLADFAVFAQQWQADTVWHE